MNDQYNTNLATYWDDFSDRGTSAATLEALDAHVVAELEALFATPLPNDARERARQQMRAAMHGHGGLPEAVALPRSEVKKRPSGPAQSPQRWFDARPGRSRLALAAIAAALLLLLGSLAAFWGGDLARQDDQGGVIPAVIDKATPDWPVYRGTSTRDGVTLNAGPTEEPSLLWSVEIGGSAKMAPAVANGLVYSGSSNHLLLALDETTGEERWRFEGDASLEMTPTVANGMVYIPSAFGTLYAIDAETGVLRWTFAEKLGAYAMPAVDNGILYAGSMDGVFYAIDATTGMAIWTFEPGKPFQRPAAVAGGIVFTGNDDGYLYALDANDGSIVWQHYVSEFSVGMPSVANGAVYIAQTGGGILVLDQATGAPIMTLPNPGRSGLGPPAVSSTIVVAGGGIDDPNMHVFDVATGTETVALGDEYGGPWLASPAVADGIVYAVSTAGKVLASDPTTGDPLWEYDVKVRPNGGMIESGPVIAGGVLYVSTDLGVIYALK